MKRPCPPTPVSSSRSCSQVPLMINLMTRPTDRPLLFLDVDGPLIPFGGAQRPSSGADSTRQPPEPVPDGTNPLLARLRPEDGPRLLALGCDLVWATTWMADANEVVGPRLGLPQLPVVEFPDSDDEEGRLHWKTRSLIAWAAGRSFVWVDDEITAADRTWVSAHHPARALLHRVHPGQGLTDADFEVIDDWVTAL